MAEQELKACEVETVLACIFKEPDEQHFICGAYGMFTIDDLREIEDDIRNNHGDYYDPGLADAEGTALERFSVKRVNMHPDDGGGYWELKPFISAADNESALTARLSAAEAEVERLRAEVDAMGLAMLRIRRDAVTIDDAMTIIDPFDLTAAARRQQGGTDAR